MPAPMSLFDVPDAVLETVTEALVRGVRSIDPASGRLTPMAVVRRRDGDLRVHRPVGEAPDARLDRAREIVRISSAAIVVLVYPGQTTHHLVRVTAVYAQVHAADDDYSLLFVQRMRPGPHGPEADGSPAFLGAVEPLRGVPAATRPVPLTDRRERTGARRGWSARPRPGRPPG